MEIAPNLPKYSCIVLDEWDEKTYFDKLALALRQFFRKCRQLNLFMIIIIPDFFQLPKGYAISRSVFAIDVKFSGDLIKVSLISITLIRRRSCISRVRSSIIMV